MLYAVTFPDYRESQDSARVKDWRRDFGAPHAKDVPGHITLVFGTNALCSDAFQAHVRAVATKTRPFTVTFAAPLIWPENDAYLLFAVPEEGFSQFSDLHDRLYSGPLEPALRTDLPYVPHMTLGQHTSHNDAKQARDHLRAGLPIKAAITSLSIIDASQGIKTVEAIPLGEAA